MFSGFEKFQLLPQWNPSNFPKKTERLTALRILQQYYALRPIVVKTITKISDYQNFRGLFGRNIVGFLKKTRFLNAMRSLIQKDHLKHFLKKTRPRAAVLRERRFFLEKNHLSSQENLSSERFRFESSQANAMFGTPPRTNLTTVSGFYKNKSFFEKPFGFSRKERKVRTFWDVLSIFTVRIFENHTTRILPVKATLKTMKLFPKNTHVILQ